MEWRFWKKKEQKEEINLVIPEKKYKAKIIIYVDQTVFKLEFFSWERAGIKSHQERLSTFRNFIKWYHCRLESKSYSFYYKNGVTVLDRKHITGYNITSVEYFE